MDDTKGKLQLIRFYDNEFYNLKSRAESMERDLRELSLLNINQKRDFLTTILNICFGIIGSAFAAIYGFKIFDLNLFLILSLISLSIVIFYIVIFLQTLLLSESESLDKIGAFHANSFRKATDFVLESLKIQKPISDFHKEYFPLLSSNDLEEKRIKSTFKNYSDIHYRIIIVFFLSGVVFIILSFIFKSFLVLK